jgi:mersacidin/lichenicidin family type 2 lantibiotic
MSHVARAWKDPEYRATLAPDQLAALPASPVGAVELSDADLSELDGGTHPTTITITVTFEAGCYTWNSTYCNGTCAFLTIGCCGG